MNEGGLIKKYVTEQNISNSELAGAVGIPEDGLTELYQSQTVAADVKQKLKAFFNRSIFDGSLLMKDNEPDSVPDQSANRH